MYSSTLSLNSGLDGVCGQHHAPVVQEDGWAPGPVWTGVEILAPTRIRSPECPSRRESLYGLCYPG